MEALAVDLNADCSTVSFVCLKLLKVGPQLLNTTLFSHRHAIGTTWTMFQYKLG